MIADYERQRFSEFQALFPDASKASSTILTGILPPGSTKTGKALNAGGIAGAVVGGVLGVVIVALGVFWWLWRHRVATGSRKTLTPDLQKTKERDAEIDGQGPQLHELDCSQVEGIELDGMPTTFLELDSQTERKAELAEHGNREVRHELF